MTISKVDSILSKHPFFKTLDTNRKLGIYNKIYTKIFYIRSDITVINPTTYSTDKSYMLYHIQPDDVNLSAHKNVDSFMEQHSLLSGLTDAQKIAVFEIAAYRINMYRTLREDQEYYFSTHKEDTVYVKKHIFQPILAVAQKVLTQTVRTLVYSPLATATALVLSLLSHTKYYTPALTVSSKVWTFVSSTFTYIPLVSVQTEVMVSDHSFDTVYLPLSVVSHSILAGHNLIYTYSSALAVSSKIIEDVDYTATHTYSPYLTVEAEIITGLVLS